MDGLRCMILLEGGRHGAECGTRGIYKNVQQSVSQSFHGLFDPICANTTLQHMTFTMLPMANGGDLTSLRPR